MLTLGSRLGNVKCKFYTTYVSDDCSARELQQVKKHNVTSTYYQTGPGVAVKNGTIGPLI